MSETAVRRRERSYSEEEIGRGLAAVAYFNGNTRKASRELAKHDCPIPRETLRDWADHIHAGRYEQIRADLLPRIHERVAEKHTELAEDQIKLSQQMTEKLAKEYEGLDPKELAGAIRNISTGAGISTDKVIGLRGIGYTVTHKHEGLESLQRSLASKGFVIDAEVVEEAEALEQGSASTSRPDTPPQTHAA